ncbi:MAG: ATP-binding protein [Deferribacterota bacterium]|nr:ATP-binding protein [Deferribacterota bacterium]
MINIAYCLNNNNIINNLKKFAKEENINCYNLIADNNINKNISIIFIDHIDNNVINKFKNALICSINLDLEHKFFYYKLNENFNIFQFRAIIDVCLFRGLISYYISDTIPKYAYLKYEIPNNIFKVDEIVYSITKDLIYFYNLKELQKIRVGLCEMITNAIEHGNLEIDNKEKHKYTKNGCYNEFLKEKLKTKEAKERKIIVELKIDKNKLVIIIEDEGKGFDTNLANELHKENDQLKLYGRGILITKNYFDRVTYNKIGNKVRLLKYL